MAKACAPWEFLEPPRPVGVDAARVVHMLHPRMEAMFGDLDARLGGFTRPKAEIEREAAVVCSAGGISDSRVVAFLAGLIRPLGIHRRHAGGLVVDQHGQSFGIHDSTWTLLLDLDRLGALLELRPDGPAVLMIGDVAAVRRFLQARVDRLAQQASRPDAVYQERAAMAAHALLVTHPAWSAAGVTRLLGLMEAWAQVATDDMPAFLSASIPTYQEMVGESQVRVERIDVVAICAAAGVRVPPPPAWPLPEWLTGALADIG